jgi:hypothetical protein
MKLQTTYLGGDDLFEGDRTVQLRSLPIGARAITATVKAKPVGKTPETLFQETIDNFGSNGRGDPNATRITDTGFVEVDFHARRTLASVTGTNLTGTNLGVDVGGSFIDVNKRGALGGPVGDLLSLAGDTNPLPGLAVNKFRLVHLTANPTVTSVTIRSVPTNLTVKLGQTPPFWVRVGELAAPDTSPDFAEALNAFLLTAPNENGFYQIPFVIHSDTLARLDVELNIDYVIEQAVLPPHLPEISLSYDFSTLPSVAEALTTIRLPRDAMPVPGRTGAQIQGQFQATRVAQGSIGEELNQVLVEVSPQCSLAQAILADREIEVVGIDLPLGKTQAGLSGLNIAIRADDDGKPTGDVQASAEVKVAKPVPGQSTWGTATLATPFRVAPAERYWIVLQSRDNPATWNATAGQAVAPDDLTLPAQCSRDGGLSWRAATARDAQQKTLSALLRLREKPDRFSVPVQLQIGKGPGAVRRELDEYAPLGRIEFNFDFAEKLTEHLGKPELAPLCGTGELLVNGNFDQPPHDDATRKLFGFDEKSAKSDSQTDAIIEGIVDLSQGADLSVERFITLGIGRSSPIRIRIDCAGADPAHTTLAEVVEAIGQATDHTVASNEGPKLVLTASSDLQLGPWCKADVPTGWQGEAGRIVRGKPDGRIVVGLIASLPTRGQGLPCFDLPKISALDPIQQAELSQRIPITGKCSYRLRFRYLIEAIDNQSSPVSRWQIDWLDNAGRILNTEGALLFRPRFDGTDRSRYEAHLVAPPDAVEAQLRFTQELSGLLTLSDASFSPTFETVTNGQFRVMEETRSHQSVPVAWNLASGLIDTLDASSHALAMGIRLRGDAPEDSALAQTFEITAGKIYVLNVRARLDSSLPEEPATRPIQQRARVELRWLNTDQPIGAPIILPLDGCDFPDHAWSGPAPAGANRAEVRLIQPRGQGNLIVESVSLTQIDQVEVPLIFLAETPGALTISNLRVTYDLPEKQELLDAITSQLASNTRMVRQLIAQPMTLTTTLPPITTISGIGEARAKGLAALGLGTIAKLAAADPEAIAQAISGVTPKMASDFVDAAKRILAGGPA